MRFIKRFCTAMLALLFLCLTSCAPCEHSFGNWHTEKYATSFEEGREYRTCEVCSKKERQKTPLVPAEPQDFSGGYVTSNKMTVKASALEIEIPEGIYLVDGLCNSLEVIVPIIEESSGLSLEGNPNYSDGTVKVRVVRKNGSDAEFGSSYATSNGVTICPGDILDLSVLIHETTHALHYRESNWFYCQLAMEGVATYTTYKVQKYIEENHPELTELAGNSNGTLASYKIDDYSKLYEQPVEYWMENTFDYSYEKNYSIGFRFMWYLDEVYGNFTDWIYAYESYAPYCGSERYGSPSLYADEELLAFTMAYGEDVFDNFYPWLKANEALFEVSEAIDIREVESINIYPTFAGDTYFTLNSLCGELLYRDLYIGLDAGREYLEIYKNREADSLMLEIDDGVIVMLYDADGMLIRVESDGAMSLDGVSFIKLFGEGTLTRFDITGF